MCFDFPYPPATSPVSNLRPQLFLYAPHSFASLRDLLGRVAGHFRFAVPDVHTNSWLGFFSWRRQLSLAPFLARLEDADVPGLILGVDGAEPPPTDAAVGRCRRIAGLSHRRNRLTGPLEASGISLVRLLQHIPSSCGQYTPSSRGGVPVGSYLNS
jgi:hypothetical protein